jgi:DNA-binding NarL/FixJ family response regulator
MPKINGFELREKIHTNVLLQLKCIPYLFFTTNADKKSVINAYSMSVQGFFVKPNGFEQLEKTIKTITDYWSECIAPNEYE